MILGTEDIAVERKNAANTADTKLVAATQVALKNCRSIKNCRTEVNDIFVDYADFISIAMPMYNLTEYSDNYFDTSGSLWDFKRDEVTDNAYVTNDNNAPSFKYKASIIDNAKENGTKMEWK